MNNHWKSDVWFKESTIALWNHLKRSGYSIARHCPFSLWERGSLTKNYFENAVDLLNREYEAIRRLADLNELAYSAAYNFVPRVGQHYHLYQKADGSHLLSMIENWQAHKFIVSLEFTADSVWKEVSPN